MFEIFRNIFRVGVITEAVTELDSAAIESIGKSCHRLINKYFAGSLAIRMVDAGSCNGCELEIQALNNAFYDIERFGIHFVASPRHADMLFVTGPVAKNMEAALKITYQAMPEPKLVVAIGDCGVSGGEFGVSYASLGAVANVIPVDYLIPGCPPTPLMMVKGLVNIISDLKNKK